MITKVPVMLVFFMYQKSNLSVCFVIGKMKVASVIMEHDPVN